MQQLLTLRPLGGLSYRQVFGDISKPHLRFISVSPWLARSNAISGFLPWQLLYTLSPGNFLPSPLSGKHSSRPSSESPIHRPLSSPSPCDTLPGNSARHHSGTPVYCGQHRTLRIGRETYLPPCLCKCLFAETVRISHGFEANPRLPPNHGSKLLRVNV